MATECLSEYLEKDINSDEVKAVQEIKQKVQDKYRYLSLIVFLKIFQWNQNSNERWFSGQTKNNSKMFFSVFSQENGSNEVLFQESLRLLAYLLKENSTNIFLTNFRLLPCNAAISDSSFPNKFEKSNFWQSVSKKVAYLHCYYMKTVLLELIALL